MARAAPLMIMTITLSRIEVVHLHDEIGALPRSRVGPKLLEFGGSTTC